MEKTTLTLVDGVSIVVPDSPNLITTYVLREQEDWFEDEIKFLRHLLKPGQKVIDIGANYGVYTLSMAKAIGPEGFAWAFEPASSTSGFLAESLALNGFEHVVLDRSALSSMTGTARLSLQENTELNELVRTEGFEGDAETVPLVTLDSCMKKYGWRDIDFLKIDAEGEEQNIIRGGLDFLAAESPLIQYEIKAGNAWHFDLTQAFAALGYQSYRLVPGLQLLVPYNTADHNDSFLLNLFCCKADRAALLAAEGRLIDTVENPLSADTVNSPDKTLAHNWRELTELPYGRLAGEYWEQMIATGQSGEVETALGLYLSSRDAALPPAARFAALEASFMKIRELCAIKPAFLRLASLARIARDYGARTVACEALNNLCQKIFNEKQVVLIEPFLAPGERFDILPPQNRDQMAIWAAAAALEELERTRAFSSYYSPSASLPDLEKLMRLGFASHEMKRRLTLIQQRTDLKIPA